MLEYAEIQHGDHYMKTLRIKDAQEELIRQLAIEFNKKLIMMNRQPLKDSELTHKLLDEAINRAAISPNGEIHLRNE
nr:MAG TPA: hypothetical protein [Inoviridae sp.]